MNRYYKFAAILFTFFMIFTEISFSQTYGQIFTNSEANQKFGPVASSITITLNQLQDFLNKTNNVLMFRLKDGNLLVLGDGRKLIYPSSATVAASDVYNVFSKSVIMQLINVGSQATAQVEIRISTLTITIGQFTLEQSLICPPFCP
jgi:hypothetical protein